MLISFSPTSFSSPTEKADAVLGEKGVGRFAAHKLGDHIAMTTRSAGNREIYAEIDWTRFQKKRYLEDVPIEIVERRAKRFKGKDTGTRIEITKLRDDWTRGMIRKLYRSVISICSPFTGPSEQFPADGFFELVPVPLRNGVGISIKF